MTGCPECDWDGEVAETHTRTVQSYTHVVVIDSEIFRGKTCTKRVTDKESLLSFIL